MVFALEGFHCILMTAGAVYRQRNNGDCNVRCVVKEYGFVYAVIKRYKRKIE